MRIDRIRIQNFRRLKFVDLELPDGVIALVGRNGAGKSTLLEAIGWALYGHDAARTGKDLIKRRGAAPGDDVRVHLAFRFGPHVYEITREMLGKSESHVATMKVDGKIVVPPGAASAREATAYVARLFHMDRDAFFTTLVARQRELAALTDAKASERKRLLIGLLRLDAVDGAILTARARRRDSRAQLVGLRSALRDPRILGESLGKLRAEAEAGRVKLVEADARIVALTEEVEGLREVRDAGRKRAEEHKGVLAQIRLVEQTLLHVGSNVQARSAELVRVRASAAEAALLAPRLETLPTLRAHVERLGAARARHEELLRVRGEIEKALVDVQKATHEAAEATATLAGLSAVRTLAERVAAQRPLLQTSLEAAWKAASDAEALVRERARQLHDIETKEKRVREMGPETPCPTCTRPLREHHGELVHGFRAEMDALRASIDAATQELATRRGAEAKVRADVAALTERERELREKLNRLHAEESRLASAKARVLDATARHARLLDAATALGQEPYDAGAETQERALLKELETLAARHARLAAEAERETDLVDLLGELSISEAAARASLSTAAAQRDALGFDPVAHDAVEGSSRAAEQRLTEARVLRERLQGELLRQGDAAKSLETEIAHQQILAAEAKTLEERVTLLEQLAGDRDGLLVEFKDHLIGRLRPLLSNHAGALFRELTDGRYTDLEVDEDYGLLVHDEGAVFELARFSGGEGDLANLCLRLAVSQVVAERAGTDGFGFLALDEIFGSQDEIRKQNILRALAGLQGRFRQILVITHIPDVKDAAECVLRVEALDDGTSTVTVEAAP